MFQFAAAAYHDYRWGDVGQTFSAEEMPGMPSRRLRCAQDAINISTMKAGLELYISRAAACVVISRDDARLKEIQQSHAAKSPTPLGVITFNVGTPI